MSEATRRDELISNLEVTLAKVAQAAEHSGRRAEEVTVVVVSKTYPVSDIEILYDLGVRHFGENRDQEARLKVDHLPRDINWHFQGQIQSNKINSITSWARYIHSVDRVDIFKKIISRIEAHPDTATQRTLIQINLDPPAEREGRGGVVVDEIDQFLSDEVFSLHQPAGVMAVAPLTGNAEEHFQKLVNIAHRLQGEGKVGPIISAGMSGDFEAAIHAGATLIRVGSSILGKRTYPN